MGPHRQRLSRAFSKASFIPDAAFQYTGLAHRADQLFEDSLFDGDANVIVDFKYATHPNLTWWFDHHQSAFLSPEDAEHFRRDTSGRKLLDPSLSLLHEVHLDVAKERYGFDAPDLEELVTWADIVDGALYESAQAAVEMDAPAMKLTLVIEGSKGPTSCIKRSSSDATFVRLAEIIADPEIKPSTGGCSEKHLRNIDVIRKAGSCDSRRDLSSTWSNTASRAITNSSRTICFRIRPTRCPCRLPASGQRFRSDRIRGCASRCGIIWRPSVSATAAADIRRWGPSAFRPGPSARRAKQRPKSAKS